MKLLPNVGRRRSRRALTAAGEPAGHQANLSAFDAVREDIRSQLMLILAAFARYLKSSAARWVAVATPDDAMLIHSARTPRSLINLPHFSIFVHEISLPFSKAVSTALVACFSKASAIKVSPVSDSIRAFICCTRL